MLSMLLTYHIIALKSTREVCKNIENVYLTFRYTWWKEDAVMSFTAREICCVELASDNR